MVDPTARDRVWKFALAKAVRNDEPVRPPEIAEIADVSERMARDCLLVISDAGWLERRTRRSGRVEYVRGRGVSVDVGEQMV